jgi:hypothetical protein
MSGRPGWILAVVLALVLVACGPASERPLRGAQPGSAAPPTVPGLPPTLTASQALRQPSAVPAASPSAAAEQAQPSPGVTPRPSAAAAAAPSPSAAAAPPIVRTIVPAANSHVPAGAPVTLSAVLVGRGADLASASLAVNGADAGAQIDKPSPRNWTIHASQSLPAGPHSVRVLVRDASGAAGGFTWQFVVGDVQPTATPAP